MDETFPPDPEQTVEQSGQRKVEALHPSEAASPALDEVVVLKRSHLYALLLPLAFVVGVSVGYLFWGRAGGQPAGETQAVSVAPAPDDQSAASSRPEGQPEGTASAQSAAVETREVQRYDVPVDDDPVLGPADAPITLIEFSDFECPFCRKWHEEVFKRLLETYPDQIRYVYRDFPLSSIHANAISAAEASNCAAEQNAFWEYHDKLFSMELGLGAEAYLQYARDLDLDISTFQECVDTRRYRDEVQGDYDYAAQLGIRSTPTFFINGLALVGAQPFEVFQQVIDQELAGEIP